MAFLGMIFDVDGTLVDSNPYHVRAWHQAFRLNGYDVPVGRIEREIGKGGDKLVPSILGEAEEARVGEALRRTQKEEFLAITKSEQFRVFPGATEVFEALRKRGIRTALATSSNQKHLAATLASAGVDLTALADVVVTKSDATESKPSPDIVEAAVEKLELSAAECAMVGDTIYDGQASESAGVVFLGLLSGGTPEQDLQQAGAAATWRDIAHLLHDLDRALEIGSLTQTSGS
jgi:HAD superfamily hydrolase (TIGR01549 family)